MQKLQALIVHYERQLHCPITRRQRVVIDKLLHHDFFEIGRSGMQFDKQQVIDALISETAEQPIQADNFELSVVDENSMLLTYLSYKADDNNIVSKTWRTSLWVNPVYPELTSVSCNLASASFRIMYDFMLENGSEPFR
ncbi:nuclear transport factor 2 family protein [Pectobacterium aroidearum]|uniref:nuclear transport factor 2 family protein n=1 Tax=Pectobacterium aroidearum TaxID=1201031 RepID=UPI00261510C1|nr:nuclear transport factor 2 family protein [Pectobacterium aroidearum]WKA64585.1 nuclear transport factor 2 family protein [Pectobacterium aroidearum]